jgi:hypothetical protein
MPRGSEECRVKSDELNFTLHSPLFTRHYSQWSAPVTPEQITAMVQALGYPVCVSIALFFALVLVFRQYVSVVTRLTAATDEHAVKMAAISHDSNEALKANTTSNRKLAELIDSRLVCKADAIIAAVKPRS